MVRMISSTPTLVRKSGVSGESEVRHSPRGRFSASSSSASMTSEQGGTISITLKAIGAGNEVYD